MKHYSKILIFLSLLLPMSCVQSKKLMVVEASIPINVSSEEGFDESFFIENQDVLESCGWQYNDGVLSFNVRFPNRELITVKGEKLSSNINSEVDVNGISNESLMELSISIGENTITLVNKDGTYTIDAGEFFASMDGKSCCEDSTLSLQTKVVGETTQVPRCQDYNGPLGNGQNDQSGLQRIVNFIGSDCNIAMNQGLCLDEHTNGKGGCYNSHEGKLCSELINH